MALFGGGAGYLNLTHSQCISALFGPHPVKSGRTVKNVSQFNGRWLQILCSVDRVCVRQRERE
jgi:hypothetical protein